MEESLLRKAGRHFGRSVTFIDHPSSIVNAGLEREEEAAAGIPLDREIYEQRLVC